MYNCQTGEFENQLGKIALILSAKIPALQYLVSRPLVSITRM